MSDTEYWKEIKILVKKPASGLTEGRMEEKKEYNTVIEFLHNNLKSSHVIAQVISELTDWQESIINDLAKESE